MGEHSTSNRLAVDQPTRGADRNRSLADQADPATDEMLLPSLDDGITLLDIETDMGPIQVVGSGATVNDATQNAFDRASKLLDMSEGEIRARCTFTGGVQIGRLPGVVQLDMLVPMDLLEQRGLDSLVRDQYGI